MKLRKQIVTIIYEIIIENIKNILYILWDILEPGFIRFESGLNITIDKQHVYC